MGSNRKPLQARPSSQAPPKELQALPQWVAWKGDKAPRQVNGRLARVDDPTTWTSYEKARATVEGGRADGVGFVFTESDPFCGIDLDNCYRDGSLDPEAAGLIKELGSYA